jgi:hypothetical protein
MVPDATAGKVVNELVDGEQPQANDAVERSHRHGLSVKKASSSVMALEQGFEA